MWESFWVAPSGAHQQSGRSGLESEAWAEGPDGWRRGREVYFWGLGNYQKTLFYLVSILCRLLSRSCLPSPCLKEGLRCPEGKGSGATTLWGGWGKFCILTFAPHGAGFLSPLLP